MKTRNSVASSRLMEFLLAFPSHWLVLLIQYNVASKGGRGEALWKAFSQQNLPEFLKNKQKSWGCCEGWELWGESSIPLFDKCEYCLNKYHWINGWQCGGELFVNTDKECPLH